jgi:hypothetical protein
MAFSGLRSNGSTNRSVEIFDPGQRVDAVDEPVDGGAFTPPLFPRMFLLPNGRVFYTGQGSGSRTSNSWIFDPTPRTWASSAATTRSRDYGAHVLLPLYPPSYVPKVMSYGGADPGTNTTEFIDLSAATPAWTAGPNLSSGRIELNAVLLPNGRVLVHGGSLNNESPDAAGRNAQIYNPAANAFDSAGTASYSRLYHSSSLLLPDATVAIIGSNPGSRSTYEPAIETYSPPYLFDANDLPVTNRPVITSVPTSPLAYGAAFSVGYTSSSAIASAVLVRPGSSTHAIDMEQRMIGLCGASPQPACTGGGTLNLTTPANGNIAPPGYYMVFLLDSAGVPSVAKFIQLSPFAGAPPDGTITSPASDVTINAGGSVFFGAASGASQYSWVFPGGSPGTSTSQTPGNVSFPAAGTYVVSMTAIDASGNSDPSPPTRVVTVNPSTPNFNLEVTPEWWSVAPGQSASFTGDGDADLRLHRNRLVVGRRRGAVPDRRYERRVQPVDDHRGLGHLDAHDQHDDEREAVCAVSGHHRHVRIHQPRRRDDVAREPGAAGYSVGHHRRFPGGAVVGRPRRAPRVII